MKQYALNKNWRLTAVGGLDAVPADLKQALAGQGIAATVPGCVHTDLMAAGLLPDPYIGLNERDQLWIRDVQWCYSTTFDAPSDVCAGECIDLVCEGLDTVARIELNGQPIGESANMFIPHRFTTKQSLRETGNILSITFDPPVQYMQQMRETIGALPHAGASVDPQLPYNMIRKLACNFGWDWGPVLITAGIWQPIYLQAWGTARIESVRPLVISADKNAAEISLHVLAAAGSDSGQAIKIAYELTGPSGEKVASAQLDATTGKTATASIKVDSPDLWWPVGYGKQPLYILSITLLDANGNKIDHIQKRIGLRTVELVTQDAESNVPTFHFKINGRRVYCKGANWIPDDCFPHRVTPDRYRKRITQARDANMNMLRVWGGGLYESDDFYNVCDELGILVWQDLLTACALYPEVDPIRSEIEKEVRYHAARLSSHPSLVLWNGGNECIWAAYKWGPAWEKAAKDKSRGWGLGYWLEMFPQLIHEIDPTRPYWANSPYSGSTDLDPNGEEVGNNHHWDVWNGHGDYMNYLLHRPLFASEFGFHGPPTWPTLARSVPENERRWDSETIHHHNKQSGGQDRADRLIAASFNVDANEFDNWWYLAQLNQVRALDLGCSWFRSQSPRNSGALYWQLNDCWPVASWAAIDGDGRAKPLWYATRRFFADRLLTIMPPEAVENVSAVKPLVACMHNDCDKLWAGECVVRLLTIEGQELGRHAQSVSIEPRSSYRFDIPDTMLAKKDAMLIAELGDKRAFWFFQRDKDISYPAPEYEAELERDGGTYHLTIRAKTLLRDIILYPDRLDPKATIDDQAVTLLPGDVRTFIINSDVELTMKGLTARSVMQVANRYGKQ